MDGNIEHELDYELLGRHLTGESTPEEAALVAAWIHAAPENRQAYETLKSIWEGSEDVAQGPKVDVDKAWDKVQGRMHTSKPEVHVRRSTSVWLRIAAVMVIGIGTFFLWRSLRPSGLDAPAMLALQTAGEKRTDTLPDGTVVTLNAHSRLDFPEHFAGAATRQVKLQGEAFFDVHSNPQQPFVIGAGETVIRVVGTAFNVKATDTIVQVAVTEGKVKFEAPKAKREVLLEAGSTGRFEAKAQVMTQDTLGPDNALFWMTGRLVYRNRPLDEVIAEIGQRWNVLVSFSTPSIGNCRLSAAFEQPSIESILNMIAETFTLDLTHNENGYLLSGQGCQ